MKHPHQHTPLILILLLLTGLFVHAETSHLDVVMDNNYPPYVFYDSSGHLQGILVDEWALFEKKTGISVTLHAMDWNDALEGMAAGEYDVIDTIFFNPERDQLYDFTEPYADLDVSIFFHKNISGINTVESLKGFSVAAKRGDQAVNVLLDAGVEKLSLYDSYEAIINDAAAGKVMVFVVDDPPALYFLHKLDLLAEFNRSEALYTGQFHRAVKKGETALLATIEQGFARISPMEHATIQEKWFGKTQLVESAYLKSLTVVLLTIGAIALGLLSWNMILRKSVQRKTADLSSALETVKYNQSKLAGVIDSMPDWVFVVNAEGLILDFLSSHATDKLIAPPEAFIGKPLMEFFSPELVGKFLTAIHTTLQDLSVDPVEYSLQAQRKQFFEARFAKLSINEVITIIRDITDSIESRQLILDLSIKDTPTGVYNRNYFENQLLELQLSPLDSLSLIMVDIDGLKLVNDTLGHVVGDHYLKTVAELLMHQFPDARFVSRIGGDEFVVVLENWKETDILCAKQELNKKIEIINAEERAIPFSISVGFSTFSSHITCLEDMLKEADDFMFREKLFHRQSARSKTIETLSTMLAERDFITQGHGDRMADLVLEMARILQLPESQHAALTLFANFHDIGKVGISDAILFKPDKLTDKEFSEMKRHTEIGYRIAEASPDMMAISEWIYKHHEWWNGTGYPFGLSGEGIPLPCRILSIVDAYDAMTNDRPYRRALSESAAIEELEKGAGTQFDPDLVQLFVQWIMRSRPIEH